MSDPTPNWFPANEWELLDWARAAAQRLTDRFNSWLVPMCDADRPATELASLYVATRGMVEAFETPIKLLENRLRDLGEVDLPRSYERDKIAKTLNIETPDADYRVTIQTSLRASILKDHKAEAYAWLRDNNLGDLIVGTVNSGTLSAAGRKMLEEGRELPEELFSTYYQNTPSVTKIKPA